MIVLSVMLHLCRCDKKEALDVKITFTPMHGVGGEPVQRIFRAFNLQELIPVVEQMEPDPEFPTVTFPNPEEGKSALVSPFQWLYCCS